MDMPSVTQLLRSLYSSPARNCLQRRSNIRILDSKLIGRQKRYYTDRNRFNKDERTTTWLRKMDTHPANFVKQLKEYPRVTAADLRHRNQRPRRVKMTIREFIDDSLYNPNYGYFSKHATIFRSTKAFDFRNIADEQEFQRLVDEDYKIFEDQLDEIEPDVNRQLWHTPTELFRPHYGEAIARYLVTNYKMTLYPYHDLIIYESGAGNGTLMRNVLDHIREFDMDVYNRTQVKIIEISSSLAELQMANISRSPYAEEHMQHVEIINKSIFDWDIYVHSPCFFLAQELVDNFSHDAVRYDPITKMPLQGSVLIDERGEFFEFFERKVDKLVERYLKLREIASRGPLRTPVSGSNAWRKFVHSLPLSPNLTGIEYLPTRLMEFFEILNRSFPAHRLILSDFTFLPTVVPGLNAPIVQTRHERRNVTVTTPLVHQGYFDIFFPTNFVVMEDIYRAITGKLTRVSSHHAFLQNWAYLPDTQTRNGENPMLSFYKNAAVMTTV